MKKVRLYEDFLNEGYVKSKGYKAAVERLEGLERQLDPNSMLCKGISKKADNVTAEFREMKKHMDEILSIWQDVEYTIAMSNESVEINEAKLNTLRDVIKAVKKEYGPTPTEQSLADFVVRNYKDITGEDLEDSIPAMNDKLADIVAHYRFDGEDFMIAFDDAREGR